MLFGIFQTLYSALLDIFLLKGCSFFIYIISAHNFFYSTHYSTHHFFIQYSPLFNSVFATLLCGTQYFSTQHSPLSLFSTYYFWVHYLPLFYVVTDHFFDCIHHFFVQVCTWTPCSCITTHLILLYSIMYSWLLLEQVSNQVYFKLPLISLHACCYPLSLIFLIPLLPGSNLAACSCCFMLAAQYCYPLGIIFLVALLPGSNLAACSCHFIYHFASGVKICWPTAGEVVLFCLHLESCQSHSFPDRFKFSCRLMLDHCPSFLSLLIYCHYFSCCRVPSLCLLSLVSIAPAQSVMQLMTCCRSLTQIIATAYLVYSTHQCELSPLFLLNLSLNCCRLSAR